MVNDTRCFVVMQVMFGGEVVSPVASCDTLEEANEWILHEKEEGRTYKVEKFAQPLDYASMAW